LRPVAPYNLHHKDAKTISSIQKQPGEGDLSCNFSFGKQGEEPLVCDLIEAAATQPTRSLLGLPDECEPLYLFSLDNGVEVGYNSVDSLTSLGDHEKEKTKPLIIRSKRILCNKSRS
jgi:hypothetical protein